MVSTIKARLFCAVLAGVVLSLAAAGAGQAQTRRALVIGVNDYLNVPKLQKAVGDAQALKTTLEKLGFAVDILSARDEHGALVVRYRETIPPPGAITAQVITTAYCIVALPRRDGDVRFERIR